MEVQRASSLFYILAESQNDPKTDPVVMYMNGGPGASSLAAFFGANGPMLYVDQVRDLSLSLTIHALQNSQLTCTPKTTG